MGCESLAVYVVATRVDEAFTYDGDGMGRSSNATGGVATNYANRIDETFRWLYPVLFLLSQIVVAAPAFRYRLRLIASATAQWTLVSTSADSPLKMMEEDEAEIKELRGRGGGVGRGGGARGGRHSCCGCMKTRKSGGPNGGGSEGAEGGAASETTAAKDQTATKAKSAKKRDAYSKMQNEGEEEGGGGGGGEEGEEEEEDKIRKGMGNKLRSTLSMALRGKSEAMIRQEESANAEKTAL
jgi:hypothetical protein